jgi:4-alpha-glucanotransferase
MKLLFNLEYQTTFGEDLVLNIQQDDAKVTQHKMSTLDGYHWYVEITNTWKAGTTIHYYYSLMRGEEVLRHEWLIEAHQLQLAAKKATHYAIYDHWIDIPEDAFLYSSAFTECVMPSECKPCALTNYARTIQVKVRAPQMRMGERLAIVGEPASLGAWDTQKGVAMTEQVSHEWVVNLDAEKLPVGRFEFKFVVLNAEPANTPMWEPGANRSLDVPNMQDNETIVYELSQAYFPIYPWKGAGVVIPIFSLRSEGSFGVGDFGDLKMMVEWAAKTQQRFIQVLPINDTNMTGTWQDSYPYNAISIYALHPQYTDFRQLPEIKDKEKKAQFESLRQELNSLPQIDYERMFEAKMDYLHVLFEQEWKRVKATKAYKQFYEDNKEWLEPYAQFCVNRDKYGTAVFSMWPKEASNFKLQTSKEQDFWYFVQFNLDQQMHAAHEYARKHRVVLKGDIPIGISRDGVEAWVEPKYFNLNGQAGAPPDPFSADGQNWGFPTYNWDEMLKDGCQWWVRRFRKMSQYFDAYRIDHVLGFFRIWEIPMPEKSGLKGQFAPALGLSREEIEGYGIYGHDDLFLVDHKRSDRWHPRIAVQYQQAYENLNEGEKYNFNRLYNDYFYRRNNQFWYQEAMKKLPRLTQATRMLCCAEDLGMVPDCVPWVMNELRILSLEIQTMPKDPNIRFGKLSHNPYRSVCTFSTHDMPTLRQWWDEDWEQTQEYYNGPLRRGGAAPHPLPGWLAKDIVSRQLTSPSMLCLLSLQDWLSIDEKLRLPDQNAERINIPAIPRYYWRYRMHLTIEQLLKENEFNETVKTLITQSGRK